MDSTGPHSKRFLWPVIFLVVIIVVAAIWYFHAGKSTIMKISLPQTAMFNLVSASSTSRYYLTVSRTGPTLTPLGGGKEPISRPDDFSAFAFAGASGPEFSIVKPSGATHTLGVGRPIALLASGQFLVATPSSIERIDPVTFATTSVVANGSLVAAASPTGDRLATLNRTNSSVDIYALNPAGRATYQYSIPPTISTPAAPPRIATTTAGTTTPMIFSAPAPVVNFATALGFVNSSVLFVQTATSTATIYYLATSTSAVPVRFANVPILQTP